MGNRVLRGSGLSDFLRMLDQMINNEVRESGEKSTMCSEAEVLFKLANATEEVVLSAMRSAGSDAMDVADAGRREMRAAYERAVGHLVLCSGGGKTAAELMQLLSDNVLELQEDHNIDAPFRVVDGVLQLPDGRERAERYIARMHEKAQANER